MSLTSQIGSSDGSFKLSQKIVAALAEKFAFKFEDGWDTISSRPVESILKRIKRDKRRANPTSAIKHARTGFSYFTQKERPVCQAAHPEATFGELSRYVSEKWKALTPEKLAEFKAMEAADKIRYQEERATMLATNPVVATETAPVSEETAPVKEKKAKVAKATPVAVTATAESSAPVSAPKAKAVKAVKASKEAKEAKVVEAVEAPVVAVPAPTATPAVAAVVTTTVVESKPTKPKSAKKDVSVEVKPIIAAVAAVVEAKAVKADKPTKATATSDVKPVVKAVAAPKASKSVKA